MERTFAHMSKATKVLLLVLLEVGSLGALHGARDWSWLRLPQSDPIGWLAVNPPLDTLAALIRPMAMLAGVWMLLSTLLYAAALVSRSRISPRLARLTAPVVRRVLEGTLAVGVSTLIAAGHPAALAAETPLPHLQESAGDRPGARPAAAVVFERLGRAGAEGGQPPEGWHDGEAAATYVVRRGDHLWSIAAGRVRDELASTDNAALARYWRRLIVVNRDRLRSGDPDLIFPGETIVLPDSMTK